MLALLRQVTASPALARIVPFAVFIGLTFCQGKFGEASRYWLYLVKTLAGAGALWAVRPVIAELRWTLSWEAVVVGVGVFVLWIGLEDFAAALGVKASWLRLGGEEPAWNPFTFFGAGTGLAWLFVGVRLLGSTLIVAPLEEVFFRSFVYRYVIKPDFLAVPLGVFAWTPFVVTSLIFGFEHHEWLAGVLCGFAYQALVCRKRRLGDAITAHAITNFLLGVWVVWRGDWRFW